MILQDSAQLLGDSFVNLWYGIIAFIPNLIIAIIIFVVGWIVGALIGNAVDSLFKAAKVDHALRKTGMDAALSRAGLNLNTGKFVGALVKWFIIVAFLIASFNVLHLSEVNDFLRIVVIGYLPQVIASVLIILVTVVVADVLGRIISTSAKAAEVKSANFLGVIARWVIYIIGVLAAISQLGIAQQIIQTVFTGVVVAVSVAIGLAFGLGGQQAASEVITKVRGEISSK